MYSGKEHQEIYQALHHQFVASSLVTKVAHEKNPQNKIGCMITKLMTYPLTCDPLDVELTLKKNLENNFLCRCSSKGEYPRLILRDLEKRGIKIEMAPEDPQILKDYTVDFLFFQLLYNVYGGIWESASRTNTRKYCTRGEKS